MNIATLKESLLSRYEELSAREQGIIIIGFACVLLIVGNWCFTFLSELNTTQNKRLVTAENNLKALPFVAERYARLNKRQRQAELEYQNVEITEGVLAHLENLIQDVAGIPNEGYLIKDKAVQKFGDAYQQLPFQVSFNTSNFDKLITFLNQLEHGEKPLILSSVKLTKSSGRNPTIRVELVASTIQKITT